MPIFPNRNSLSCLVMVPKKLQVNPTTHDISVIIISFSQLSVCTRLLSRKHRPVDAARHNTECNRYL